MIIIILSVIAIILWLIYAKLRDKEERDMQTPLTRESAEEYFNLHNESDKNI
jgi:hypothetical protein